MAHQAGAYPGFSSMKRLGVFLLPPGWDASPSQGYPQHQIRRYPFIHLGGERHCESEVSCPRTQHNVPSQSREVFLHKQTSKSLHVQLARVEIIPSQSKIEVLFLTLKNSPFPLAQSTKTTYKLPPFGDF